MLQLRSQETLDRGDYGWLKARHHFVVSAKGNPANGPLGALVVWNDDEIAPGTGFGHHSHTDMEIVTYVRQGVVTHEDSAGNVGHIVAGDVQVMSAGRGISHSEHNYGDDPLKLFQIWLLPSRRGGAPRWDSRGFPEGRSRRTTDRARERISEGHRRPADPRRRTGPGRNASCRNDGHARPRSVPARLSRPRPGRDLRQRAAGCSWRRRRRHRRTRTHHHGRGGCGIRPRHHGLTSPQQGSLP